MPIEPPAPRSSDERTWGMLCHLAALSSHFVPFGNIVGPLVVWLIKKQDYPFVDHQGKESLNFQISMMLYGIILVFVLVGGTILVLALTVPQVAPFAFLLLYPIIFFLWVYDLVMVIVASVAASSGTAYRYPMTIKFIT